jgi:hypothetical protein
MSWQQFGRFLRIVFLLRVPLITLLLLGAFGPLALTVGEELLGNLLYQGREPWHVVSVSFASFLLAFTAIAVINLIFAYGEDRLEDKNVRLAQTRPVLTFVLGLLPAIVLLICTGIRTSELGGRENVVLSLAGFLLAMTFVVVSKFIQLALTDPKATPYPPPYLIFPAYLIPALEGPFERAYCWSSSFSRHVKSGFNRLAQWPLEILQPAGQGYLVTQYPPPSEPLRLRSGHVFALTLSVLAFVLYIWIGYSKADISATPARVPALVYLLLFAIVLCWVLGALTFFFDRYHFPLFCLLGVLSLVTTFTPISDHFFRTVTLERRVDNLMTPAETLGRRISSGHRRQVLVATAGGGIQAAAWTVEVLTGLEQQCASENPACDFRSSLAAISSVSGGSLGSMVYARSYSHSLQHVSLSQLRENAAASALDEVVWGWMNPDIARVVSPWFWNRDIDRSWALERKWASVNGLADTESGEGDTLLTTWVGEVRRGMPAVIFNSMIVENGRPVVFTTSNFARQDNGRGIRNFYDLYPDPPYPDVRVNTAVRLSASFPYVGPAARPDRSSPMVPSWHYVDGGYYDNYGINSLLEWLGDALENDDLRAQLPDILILQIRPFDPGSDAKPSEHGWGFQISAPVAALLNMRDTAQDSRDATDLQFFARYSGLRNPKVNVWTVRFTFPAGRGKACGKPPLSWELTEDQRNCIGSSWDELRQTQSSAMACVVGYLKGLPVESTGAQNGPVAICGECPGEPEPFEWFGTRDLVPFSRKMGPFRDGALFGWRTAPAVGWFCLLASDAAHTSGSVSPRRGVHCCGTCGTCKDRARDRILRALRRVERRRVARTCTNPAFPRRSAPLYREFLRPTPRQEPDGGPSYATCRHGGIGRKSTPHESKARSSNPDKTQELLGAHSATRALPNRRLQKTGRKVARSEVIFTITTTFRRLGVDHPKGNERPLQGETWMSAGSIASRG